MRLHKCVLVKQCLPDLVYNLNNIECADNTLHLLDSLLNCCDNDLIRNGYRKSSNIKDFTL